MKYIVVCLSRVGNESNNFRVEGKNSESVFDTMEEAECVRYEDMTEYLESETNAGRKASISGNRIEWENDDGEHEAKWYIYGV